MVLKWCMCFPTRILPSSNQQTMIVLSLTLHKGLSYSYIGGIVVVSPDESGGLIDCCIGGIVFVSPYHEIVAVVTLGDWQRWGTQTYVISCEFTDSQLCNLLGTEYAQQSIHVESVG